MEPSDKSLKTWRVTISAPESNTPASAIHSCSFCARMTRSVYLSESPSAVRSGEKTCRQWGRKWVSFSFCVDINLHTTQTSRYIAGSFFMDSTGIFKTRVNENGPSSNGDAQPATSTLQSVMNAGQKTQWLMLCRPQGVVEVCAGHVTNTCSHSAPSLRFGPSPNCHWRSPPLRLRHFRAS